MTSLEGAAAWAVAIITFGGFLVAWKNIRDGLIGLWRTFGWHGAFWAFLIRAVHAVDVIIAIPSRLDRLDTRVTVHIDEAAKDHRILAALVPKVDAIHYQLHPNGGGSAADRLVRVEAGVKGLYQSAPTSTAPVVTLPTPPRSRRRTPKDPT